MCLLRMTAENLNQSNFFKKRFKLVTECYKCINGPNRLKQDFCVILAYDLNFFCYDVI